MWDILKKFGFFDVEWYEYGGGGYWINEFWGVDDFVVFFYVEL